jgi:hypothetical protein
MQRYSHFELEHGNEAYSQALEASPEGYVVNRISAKAGRLHRTRCGHLYPTAPGLDHVRNEKWIASDVRSLEAEAEAAGVTLLRCPDCDV